MSKACLNTPHPFALSEGLCRIRLLPGSPFLIIYIQRGKPMYRTIKSHLKKVSFSKFFKPKPKPKIKEETKEETQYFDFLIAKDSATVPLLNAAQLLDIPARVESSDNKAVLLHQLLELELTQEEVILIQNFRKISNKQIVEILEDLIVFLSKIQTLE